MSAVVLSATADNLRYDFSDTSLPLATVGRGDTHITSDGTLLSKGDYAILGDSSLTDYTATFRARTPQDQPQVQIWSGFRANNRFDRYVLGIKGGLQDDLFMMRLGYRGNDELMAVRALDFHPVPGEWIKVRVEVSGPRIRVFLNDETDPRIDLEDPNSSLAPSGPVTLGGAWIPAEFDDLVITPLPAGALASVPRKEYAPVVTKQQKEALRVKQRAAYSPMAVSSADAPRTILSLDGDWLFKPTFEVADSTAALPSAPDTDWHIMNVPDFWNPIRIWLHGETMPSPTGPMPKGVSDTYYQRETDRCDAYTFDSRRTRAAWYRQWIDLPDNIRGKRLSLHFDAVSKVAEVYVNGHRVANHIGMFGPFDVEVSRYMHPGRNLVALKVTGSDEGDASTASSIDFYYSSVRDSEKEDADIKAPGDIIKQLPHGFYDGNPGGIWQPAQLIITDPARIADVFIQPSLTGATFDLELSNLSDKAFPASVTVDITDKATGQPLASAIHKVKSLKTGQTTTTFSIDGLRPNLWSPADPNLYDFTFTLADSKGHSLDSLTVTSGFRTFEVRNGLFYLNGHKYWLRGGNHIPFALAPNDEQLANTFMQLMRRGNVEVTRTHTTPWNERWMAAADRNGIGVSFEGQWPWLFLHSTPLPDAGVLKMWRTEWLELLKRFRNHPSLLFWTVNNEMKFYDTDNDLARAKEKYRYISDVVTDMRSVDPTRPICFDSNYQAKGKDAKYGAAFMDSIDDGDIDDMHAYYNWYDFSLFRFFNGEFQRNYKLPHRPLISQEMSTGYPNNETGHPTHSYQIIHQNPISIAGYEAYDFCDPANFLKVQSFITGELAEALRRSCDQGSGIMHFSYMTWFRQCYDARNIKPWPTYYALQRALSPVLVSAELWGRHQYAGQPIHTRIYLVNDITEARPLAPTILDWELVDEAGRVLTAGTDSFPALDFYARTYIEPSIKVPASLPAPKVNAKLRLSVTENGIPLASNEYDLLLAEPSWTRPADGKAPAVTLLAADNAAECLRAVGVTDITPVSSVDALIKSRPAYAVISGNVDLTPAQAEALRNLQTRGSRIVFLNAPTTAMAVYPDMIRRSKVPTEGDITFMERSDWPVFDGIEPLELRYFNNNRREIPTACNYTMFVNRHPALTELAGQMQIHAYIDGGKQQDRLDRIDSLRGLTLFDVNLGKGRATVSTMATDKALTDPVAARLLHNIIF